MQRRWWCHPSIQGTDVRTCWHWFLLLEPVDLDLPATSLWRIIHLHLAVRIIWQNLPHPMFRWDVIPNIHPHSLHPLLPIAWTTLTILVGELKRVQYPLRLPHRPSYHPIMYGAVTDDPQWIDQKGCSACNALFFVEDPIACADIVVSIRK